VAATAEGRRLTEGHRRAQLAVLAPLMRQFVAEWSSDNAFSGAAFTAWLSMFAPEISAAYALSAQAAERYYAALRGAERVPGPGVRAIVPPPAPAALVERLVRFGPDVVAGLVASGKSEPEATKVVKQQLVLAVTKEVLAGGRDSISAHMAADTRVRGWQRVPAAGCCAFCAMVASRGPVFRSRQAAGGGKQWHPGCRCQPEPVWSRRSKLTPEAQRHAALWDKVRPGSFREFRRAYERPELYWKNREHRADNPTEGP